MNNEVQATLMGIFAVGYIEQMAGREVTGEDEIDEETAGEIEAAALDCMARAESFITTNAIENPQMVHESIYHAGREAYRQAEALWLQRN